MTIAAHSFYSKQRGRNIRRDAMWSLDLSRRPCQTIFMLSRDEGDISPEFPESSNASRGGFPICPVGIWGFAALIGCGLPRAAKHIAERRSTLQ